MEGSRLEWIDGLRGVAVLLVVTFHAWNFAGFDPFVEHNAGKPTILLASFGQWGVSLFLVLSGFCLAYAPLRKRAAAHREWFSVRKFAVSRCRRILPPYYAALILFTALAFYFKSRGMELPIMRSPSLLDVLAHIALIHNNFPQFAGSIDDPLWSLGLEWQWYWAFPLLLVGCMRRPYLAPAASIVCALGWAVAMHHLPALSQQNMLPGRLTEFCCGITVARIVVSQTRIPAAPLMLATASCLGALALFPMPLLETGLYYPTCGVGFAGLVLFAWELPSARHGVSWRPVVALGKMSYSVYLVHWPILGAVEAALRFGLHAPTLLIMAAGCLASVLFGWSFHVLFERPFLRVRPAPPQARAVQVRLPAEG